jgi:hypothetical protein
MKHNILWGIILLVASLSFTAKAQKAVQGQFSVKGVLLDSLSNEGEPYSTIRISLKNNPAKPVKLAVTGADGRFDERLAVPGTYLIHFTSVGKSPVQKEFSISANRRNVDLGKILIAEATEMLKGVEVVAQKPLVKAEIDKVTYSIEDDPDSKTNTTLEMLRKVPLVTVDGEDKIQVNGSSKFKVHVNGKPNNMMSNNPTEVLRSMPANSIKSIEVITEPGAKYDAEGVAGILNIITIGAGMEGYTVTLNGGASNMRVYGGGYGTVQSGKFTVTGNYSYNYQGSQKGFEDSYREDFTSQENKFLESHRRSKSYGNFQFGSLEGSYEIDTLNLISFSMNLMTGNFTNKRIGNTQMTNHAGNPVYGYGSLGNNESGFGEVGGNMDYQHSFKKKGELLTFSYRFSHSPNNSEANTDYEDTLNVPYLLQNQYFKNDASTQEHTAQLDYTNPINSIHSIETGIKYIFRRSKSDGKYYLPASIRILHQKRIIITNISRYLFFDEMGLFKQFVLTIQFHFRYSQAFILTIKLIHFKDMLSTFHQIPDFINHPRLTQFHQLFGLLQTDLLLPLITTCTGVIGSPFDSKIPFIIPNTHPDSSSTSTTDITLHNMTMCISL